MSQFYPEKPPDFGNELEVSSVFMEHQGKVLLLLRPSETWAVPGGKLKEGEPPAKGLIREIWEELHLTPNPSELQFLRSLYVRHPKVKYQLHLFRWILSSLPPITLNPTEHLAYTWQPLSSFSDLPLLEGQLEAFHLVYPRN